MGDKSETDQTIFFIKTISRPTPPSTPATAMEQCGH
jgi:hypothetical protein